MVTGRPNPFIDLLRLAVKKTHDPNVLFEARAILKRGEDLSNQAMTASDLRPVRTALTKIETDSQTNTRCHLEAFRPRILAREAENKQRLADMAADYDKLSRQLKEAEEDAKEIGMELSLGSDDRHTWREFRWALGAIQRDTLRMLRKSLRMAHRRLTLYRLFRIQRAVIRHLWRVVFGFGVLTVLLGFTADAAAFLVGKIIALIAFWYVQEYFLSPPIAKWLEKRERADLVSAIQHIHLIGVGLVALRALLDHQLPRANAAT